MLDNFDNLIVLNSDGDLWWTGSVNLGIEYVYRKSKNYNLHFKDIQYYQIYNVDMESHILDPDYKPETYVTYDEVF